MLKTCVPTVTPEIPHINLAYWRSYKDLESCMEPVKTLSILLESSTQPTIHDTLDFFLILLYKILKTAPKRRIAASAMFNAFADTLEISF